MSRSGVKTSWTQEQLVILADLWNKDETLARIGRVLGKGKSCISETAYRQGLPGRGGGYRRAKNLRAFQRVPKLVTMRCQNCLAHYTTSPGSDSAHCSALPRLWTVAA